MSPPPSPASCFGENIFCNGMGGSEQTSSFLPWLPLGFICVGAIYLQNNHKTSSKAALLPAQTCGAPSLPSRSPGGLPLFPRKKITMKKGKARLPAGRGQVPPRRALGGAAGAAMGPGPGPGPGPGGRAAGLGSRAEERGSPAVGARLCPSSGSLPPAPVPGSSRWVRALPGARPAVAPRWLFRSGRGHGGMRWLKPSASGPSPRKSCC